MPPLSNDLTDRRVLFGCDLHRQFFLGERVRAQTTGIRVVPQTPPFDMRRGLDILAQDFWFVGVLFDVYIYPSADYGTFCREFLAFTVSPGIEAGPALATPSVPSVSRPAARAGEAARRATRSPSVDSQDVSSHETPITPAQEAGPSSARSAAAASSSSSSVLRSPQYWIGDRVPVYGEHLVFYDVPEIDPLLYVPFPEGVGQVCLYFLEDPLSLFQFYDGFGLLQIPEDWAAHTYTMARRLESALILSRSSLAHRENQEEAAPPPRRRRPPAGRR